MSARTARTEAELHPSARRTRELLADLVEVRRSLRRAGALTRLRELEVRPTASALVHCALSWAAILLAWYAVARVSPWALPLALVLVASRQRALGNLVHEASHTRRPSSRLAQGLYALPVFEDFPSYRARHLRHHQHLGVRGADPDYLEVPPAVRHHPRRLFAHFLFQRRTWLDNTLGDLPRMSVAARLRVLAWWTLFLGALAAAAGVRDAALFAALWLAARATVYHAIKVVTELSDHVGLEEGSVIGYTRNAPANWLSHLVHPNNDSYHLAHHLAPRVPMSDLPKAHALLLGVPRYRDAHHCDGYIYGRRPVSADWCAAAAASAPAARGKQLQTQR
jgi:fatty acid desaturase